MRDSSDMHKETNNVTKKFGCVVLSKDTNDWYALAKICITAKVALEIRANVFF